MKYLSAQRRLAVVIIEDRAAVRFAVPVELAMFIFWLLVNRPTRLTILGAWLICRDVATGYHLLSTWLNGRRLELSQGLYALFELLLGLFPGEDSLRLWIRRGYVW